MAGDDTGALNWATGETVAVKEIQLSNIPKGELPEIMVGGGKHVRVVATFIEAFHSPRLICSRT